MLKMVHTMQVKKLEQELINSLEKNILRPGKIVSAKVLKAENGLYLLSLNGEKVQAKSEKPLKEGELVKLKIEKLDSEGKIIVKIADSNEKKEAINYANKELISSIKKEVLKQSVKEKIFLSNKELDEIVLGLDHYKEKGNEIEDNLIKTLLFVKKHNINDEETFNSLRKYYAKKIDHSLDIENLEIQLKEEIKYLKEENTPFAKGTNTVNQVNYEKGYLNIIFGLVGFLKPITVEFKAETPNNQMEKENLTIVIKLELEKLGKLDIIINIWRKKIELFFVTYSDIDKKTFTNLDELKNRLENVGYIVENIHISRRSENDVGDIGAINYKI